MFQRNLLPAFPLLKREEAGSFQTLVSVYLIIFYRTEMLLLVIGSKISCHVVSPLKHSYHFAVGKVVSVLN
jgi:hypothetical protein